MSIRKMIQGCAALVLALLLVLLPASAVVLRGETPPSSETGSAGSDAASLSGSTSGAEGEIAEPAPAPPENGLYTPPFEPAAAAVCMVNEETGAVVYAKNADQPFATASLVKMMTAMLVIDNVPDLDGTVVASDKSWIYDELYGKNASNADIRLGETLTVRELLYAMLLPSGNEAALLLADHVSGGYMKNFLYLMHTRAASLGCTGTTFADPNGLSEGNLTTARDMCIIARAFMQYPLLVEIAATPSYEMAAHEQHAGPYHILNTNKLIVPNSPYYGAFAGTTGLVKAGKTGSLGPWQNFVSQASNGSETYTLAVLQSPNEADPLGAGLDPAQERPALYEAAALYDWAFTGYNIRGVLDTEKPITEIPVRYSSERDSVMLLPASDLRTILPVLEDDNVIQKQFDMPEFLPAPIKQGEVVGTVTLSLAGQVIGTAELLASEDVARNNTLFAIRKTQEFFGSTYFKVLLALVAAGVVIYISLVAVVVYLQQTRGDKKGGPKNSAKGAKRR